MLVDASASMTFAGSKGVSKLDYAKRLAATLAYRIVEDRDSAGLAIFDDELEGWFLRRVQKVSLWIWLGN